MQSADGQSRYWTRSLADGAAAGGSVSGVEVGMDAGIGGGFSLGFAVAPDMAAAQSSGGRAAEAAGGRYSLRGGWRGERLFAGLSLTQADWRARAAYENPAAGGRLEGRFDAAQTDLRFGLGAQLALGGGVTMTPRLDLFAGRLAQEAHDAEGAVLNAAMPAQTQRYRGWKAGLGFAADWRDGPQELKLRPTLNLSAMGVETASDAFTLRQSDRLGLVSTSSRARLGGAPEMAFGLGAGLEAARSETLSVRVGYSAMLYDGDVHHAAVAGMKLNF